VGYDDMQRSLGEHETGSKAASPIWVRFMKAALVDQRVERFEIPPNIVRASINPASGLLATAQSREVLVEEFLEGTEPVRFCTLDSVTAADFMQVDADLDGWDDLTSDDDTIVPMPSSD
jgi:penicillin-binding protein 1A